jgi:hypothetical protein
MPLLPGDCRTRIVSAQFKNNAYNIVYNFAPTVLELCIEPCIDSCSKQYMENELTKNA